MTGSNVILSIQMNGIGMLVLGIIVVFGAFFFIVGPNLLKATAMNSAIKDSKKKKQGTKGGSMNKKVGWL